MDDEFTTDEANQIVSSLYDRLFERKRYVRETAALIKSHEDHGERCCFGSGRLEFQRECLAAFEAEVAALNSALKKLGEDDEEADE